MMNQLNRRGLLAITAAGVAAVASAKAPKLSDSAALQYVDVDGARLAYQRHTGTGTRPLVFLHGYALRGTGTIYAELISRLLPEFEVFALDMRGHGGSAAAFQGWSQAAVADDLAAVVKAFGLQRPAFAGHSLGGFTGLFAQIRHPGTFSSLALLATAAAGGSGAPASVKTAFMTRGHDRPFLRETFSGMYRRPTADLVEKAVDAVSLINPAVHDAFYSNFAATRILDQLDAIDVPVLVLSGAKDTVVPPIDQYRTALAIARAKEITLPNQGHMLPLEAPDITAREITSFLAGLAQGR